MSATNEAGPYTWAETSNPTPGVPGETEYHGEQLAVPNPDTGAEPADAHALTAQLYVDTTYGVPHMWVKVGCLVEEVALDGPETDTFINDLQAFLDGLRALRGHLPEPTA
jgi:hypothetical protein